MTAVRIRPVRPRGDSAASPGPEAPELLTFAEASREFGMTAAALRGRARRGTMKTRQISRNGRRIYAVSREEVQRLWKLSPQTSKVPAKVEPVVEPIEPQKPQETKPSPSKPTVRKEHSFESEAFDDSDPELSETMEMNRQEIGAPQADKDPDDEMEWESLTELLDSAVISAPKEDKEGIGAPDPAEQLPGDLAMVDTDPRPHGRLFDQLRDIVNVARELADTVSQERGRLRDELAREGPLLFESELRNRVRRIERHLEDARREAGRLAALSSGNECAPWRGLISAITRVFDRS